MTGTFKDRLSQLIDRADDCYDVEYVVDILGLTTKEILEAFPARFYANKDEFHAFFGPMDDDA
jgi:hypothetical protein